MRLDLPRRVVLSKYAMRKLRLKWWHHGKRTCHLCGEAIIRLSDYVLDHIKPCGMGGGSRNDDESNLGPAHWICNSEKGSKRL